MQRGDGHETHGTWRNNLPCSENDEDHIGFLDILKYIGTTWNLGTTL